MANFRVNGKYMAARRKCMRFTQSELGKVVGCTDAAISMIEKGERPDPGVLLMARVARALGLRVEDLLVDAYTSDREVELDLEIERLKQLRQSLRESKDRSTRLKRRPKV